MGFNLGRRISPDYRSGTSEGDFSSVQRLLDTQPVHVINVNNAVGNLVWLSTPKPNPPENYIETGSVYVQNLSDGERIFRLRVGDVGQQDTVVPNDGKWHRCQATRLSNETYTWCNFIAVELHGARKDGDKYAVTCMQIEELPFASSYIPAEGTPVTRAEDRIFLPLSSLPKIGSTITLSTRFSREFKSNEALFPGLFYATSSDSTRQTRLYIAEGDGRLQLGAYMYGDQNKYLPNEIDTTSPLEGIASLVMDNGNGGIYLNGISGQFSYVVSQPDITSVELGYNSATHLWGHLKDFRIWYRALSPEQIASL